jgi:hypothetical protein
MLAAVTDTLHVPDLRTDSRSQLAFRGAPQPTGLDGYGGRRGFTLPALGRSLRFACSGCGKIVASASVRALRANGVLTAASAAASVVVGDMLVALSRLSAAWHVFCVATGGPRTTGRATTRAATPKMPNRVACRATDDLETMGSSAPAGSPSSAFGAAPSAAAKLSGPDLIDDFDA